MPEEMNDMPRVPVLMERIGWVCPIAASLLIIVTNWCLENYFILNEKVTVEAAVADSAEYALKIYWMGSFGLYIIAWSAAAGTCVYIVSRNRSSIRALRENPFNLKLALIAVALLLACFGWLEVAGSKEDWVYEYPIFSLIESAQSTSFGRAKSWTRYLDVPGSLMVLSFVLAVTVLLLPAPPSTAHEREEIKLLSRNLRLLRLALYAGMGLLVADVIEYSSLMQWSLAFIQAPYRPEINTIVEALVFSEGFYYSVFLAVIYIPAALILKEQAIQFIPVGTPHHESETALKEMGLLSPSPFEQLKPMAAILSPLLAGMSVKWFEMLGI